MQDNSDWDVAPETNQQFVPPVIYSNDEAGYEQGFGNSLNENPVSPINNSSGSEEEEINTSRSVRGRILEYLENAEEG